MTSIMTSYFIFSLKNNIRTTLNMAVPRACFYPNGSPATAASGSPRMLPCLPNAINSACCASNDSCLANGMCLSEDLFFYRGACTTVQYPSDSCPQFCIKSTDPGN